ncbi:MAG: hypothetical protein H0V05_00850 [Euzebyaceae bacterium]|nr:hypothetical protein [Euzebyaceae bacterium]
MTTAALRSTQTLAAIARRPLWPVLAALVLAMAGGMAAAQAPALAFAGLVALVVAVVVAVRPAVAAYALLALTPLVVGVDRGTLLPLLRPNEGLALFLGGVLLVRGTVRYLAGQRFSFRPNAVDVTILLLAFAASVVPLLWMAARGRVPSLDDILYALAMWKYFGIYLIVRVSVRTEQEVRRCLWLSVLAAGAVALIAILQSLQLLGVPGLLGRWYAPAADVSRLEISRGTSTMSSSHAVADVMTYSLAIAAGFLLAGHRRRVPLIGLCVLLLLGALSSGTFSGVLALVIGALAFGYVTGHLRTAVLALLPAGLLGKLVLQPVLQERISRLDSEGVPVSWVARLDNLRTYFWPELTTDFNYLLGVRPSARVPAPESWRDWVFIESGHTWLLWNGGIPLVVAFFLFLWVAMRTVARVARSRRDGIGVAAVASFTALTVLAVLMTFDPHLTLRGSADLSFPLLALACLGLQRGAR